MNTRPSRYLIFVLFIVLSCQHAFAQLQNRIFHQNDSLYIKDTQTVHLQFEMLNYLRNTEYFDIIEKGQTLFGSLVQINLQYQPYKNIILRGGLQTRQDFGNTGYSTVQPVFCLTLLHNKWRYNFGMLQGTTNYGFIEPMYNIDRAITNRIENGIQSIYRSKNFDFNNFLVWNEVTYRTSSNQERFTTGFTSERRFLNKNGWYLSLPIQGTLAHRGGQLNSNPTPIYTRINACAGLRLNHKGRNRITIRTENYILGSVDYSPNITQPYKNGAASWHTISVQRKGLELMFNYWAGREFQSPVGTQIYNNYNFYNVEQFRRVRHMLMSRLMYTQNLNSKTMLDLRLEPFYDFEYGRFQYSYSVYLRINFDTRLFKI